MASVNWLINIGRRSAAQLSVLAVGLAVGLALAKTSSASGIDATPNQPEFGILRPSSLVLYVHPDIADTRFVTELEGRLRTRLWPPVSVQPADLDLSTLRGLGKLEAQRLIDRLIAGIDWNRSRGVIHILLIKDDMRLPPARFNFAASAGSALTPHHVIVISLARLQNTRLFDSRVDANPALTATRAYKMIAKNAARVAGYAGSNACLFSFPRNLAELDAMPEGFCEPDLSVLNAAGIARPVK